MFCRKCGEKLADDDEFCASCGARVEKPGLEKAAQPPKQEFCADCGSRLKPGDRFCRDCGASIPEQAAQVQEAQLAPASPPVAPPTPPTVAPVSPVSPPPAAAAPTPPVQAAPPAAPPPAPVSPTPAAVPGPVAATPPGVFPVAPPVPGEKKRSRKGLVAVLVTVSALAVIAAVVLVLVFVVFKGGGPQSTVETFLGTFKNKDIDTAIKSMDPDYFKKNEGIEKLLRESLFSSVPKGGVIFTGVKYKTDTSGDKATVKVTKGKANYAEDGKKKSEDVTKNDELSSFDLVKNNGKWYIAPGPFADSMALSMEVDAETDAMMLDTSLQSLMTDMSTFYDSISAATPPAADQMRQGYVELQQKVAKYKTESDAAIKKFQDLKDLKGKDAGRYQELAANATELFNTVVQHNDLSMNAYKYSMDTAIAKQGGQPVDINTYNATIAQFNQSVDAFNAKEAELNAKVQSLSNPQ